ncbi:MAG: hypothetical protein IJ655_06220 [Lachnospiraceae bacterium]|nr:hypothetical protein [Lachnospiraceae bacterium]
MKKNIQLLDCTLRDGAYICDSRFGTPAIKGIIKKMADANVDIIECGWLKNQEHVPGTSFFHVPSDLEKYIIGGKSPYSTYVTMIDWDRYDLDYLPECDGKSIDAIRVVFPHGKHVEGIEVGKKIAEKGYKVYFQAANTLAYSNDDLIALAKCINEAKPVALSVVDTFGAMYFEDLERIVSVLDKELNNDIMLGFHSHNNQQLSFALTMHFVELLNSTGRGIIVDSSLCGMGRGAGNATTELVVSYLNKKHQCNYDLNIILDAIDQYMGVFHEKYTWGYSTPYFIAGMYCCHVNNIAYLLDNHRTNAQDMKNIIESLSPEDRKKYDYDLLESKYVENQNRIVDDENALEQLANEIGNRKVLLIAPGRTTIDCRDDIEAFIEKENPIVIGVNAINKNYSMDYLFMINRARYEYARDVYPEEFNKVKKILLSNIHTESSENEMVINYNRVIKRGWKHFDNAVIDCLRLLASIHVNNVALAGFDGFKTKYNESYADASLPTLNTDGKWEDLNVEIKQIFADFLETSGVDMQIQFVTDSDFER